MKKGCCCARTTPALTFMTRLSQTSRPMHSSLAHSWIASSEARPEAWYSALSPRNARPPGNSTRCGGFLTDARRGRSLDDGRSGIPILASKAGLDFAALSLAGNGYRGDLSGAAGRVRPVALRAGALCISLSGAGHHGYRAGDYFPLPPGPE